MSGGETAAGAGGARRGARRVLGAAAALAVLLRPALAPASNPDSTPVSPEAALTGNAVLASDDPGGGGWYNPASLAAVTRSSVQVGASAYAVTSMSVEGAIQTTLPWGSLSGTMSSVRYASVPSVVSYTFKLRDGLGASLGLWTPFHDYAGGSVSGASSGPYPGAPGVTGHYTELYSFSRTRDDTWAGAALGWQASERVRLGLMLQGSYSTRVGAVDFSGALATDSLDPLQGGSHLAISERVDLSYLGLRAVGGLQLDVAPEVRLALAVRSPGVRLLTWGSATRVISAAVLLPGVTPTQFQTTEELPHGTQPAVVEPVRVYAGLHWARGPLALSAEVDWHPALDRWLTGQGAAWNGRLGGTWQVSQDLSVGAGIFRDTSAVATGQSATTVDYYGLAGGVTYRPRAVIGALGGTGSWDMLTGVAVRGAYGTGSFTGARFTPVDPSGQAVPAAAAAISPLQAPAQAFEGSLSLFTSIVF